MEYTIEEDITIKKWVDETDATVETGLDIDPGEKETLDGEPLFHDDHDVDHEGTMHLYDNRIIIRIVVPLFPLVTCHLGNHTTLKSLLYLPLDPLHFGRHMSCVP